MSIGSDQILKKIVLLRVEMCHKEVWMASGLGSGNRTSESACALSDLEYEFGKEADSVFVKIHFNFSGR